MRRRHEAQAWSEARHDSRCGRSFPNDFDMLILSGRCRRSVGRRSRGRSENSAPKVELLRRTGPRRDLGKDTRMSPRHPVSRETGEPGALRYSLEPNVPLTPDVHGFFKSSRQGAWEGDGWAALKFLNDCRCTSPTLRPESLDCTIIEACRAKRRTSFLVA